MCGICGKFNFDREAAIAPALCKRMADTIRHRGPDDEGYYVRGPVGLGFRRLAIIDLNTGHQPLCNEDHTIWIVFNGEIYNYQELRRELIAKGHVFRTKTDTEVIVHLYEEFGEGCVERLRGMFAFAIWDERQETLFLARDRVGIKPLYYRLTEKSLIFGSEIKTILADPEVKADVSPEIIDRFLTFYYVPGDDTLFHGIKKLSPGSCMLVREGRVRIKRYWDLSFSPVARSLEDAERELLTLLEESVQSHMMSDVPVGFLLSGGVDSTAMLGFAAGKTDWKISSFTVGFDDSGITDERPYARMAAARYGTEHHEMTISARDFADFLPRYMWHMEEPVCEPPAVALFYISQLASEFVKVLISGEGGDEAFAGYPNYRSMLWLERFKKSLRPLTSAFPGILGPASRLPAPPRLKRYTQLLNTPFESYYYSRTATPFTFFNRHRSSFYSSDFLNQTEKSNSVDPIKKHLQNGVANDTLSKMLYVDTKAWLPDDLLIKADRMTMANSIELRVPLLDHKILEFAASLQSNYKVRGFATKYIAKKALSTRVPREILERKKTGFPVPYDSWMRGELKNWLWELLLDRETASRGYFRKSAVEKLLSDNANNGSHSKELFSLAVLELWHRQFLGNCVAPTPSQEQAEPVTVHV